MKTIQDIKDLFSSKAWQKANVNFQEEISEKEKNLGQFQFYDYGFRIIKKNNQIEINWAEIKEILAYKVDLLTVDEIRMDIITNSATVTISEETPGYLYFKEKIKLIFPDLDKNWESKVLKPAFAENITTIYKRKNTGM